MHDRPALGATTPPSESPQWGLESVLPRLARVRLPLARTRAHARRRARARPLPRLACLREDEVDRRRSASGTRSEIQDPLQVVSGYLEVMAIFEAGDASSSFDESDLRLANREARASRRPRSRPPSSAVGRSSSRCGPLLPVPRWPGREGSCPGSHWGNSSTRSRTSAGVGLSKMTKALHPKRPALDPHARQRRPDVPPTTTSEHTLRSENARSRSSAATSAISTSIAGRCTRPGGSS